MRVIVSAAAVLALAVLAGCTTVSKRPAPVSERTPPGKQAAAATSAASKPARPTDVKAELYTVKPGDTLPLMCFQVYGDPRHYLVVAEFNRIDDFRQLTVGAPIVFPPLPPKAVPR